MWLEEHTVLVEFLDCSLVIYWSEILLVSVTHSSAKFSIILKILLWRTLDLWLWSIELYLSFPSITDQIKSFIFKYYTPSFSLCRVYCIFIKCESGFGLCKNTGGVEVIFLGGCISALNIFLMVKKTAAWNRPVISCCQKTAYSATWLIWPWALH